MTENERLITIQCTEKGKRMRLPKIIAAVVEELKRHSLPKGHEYVLEQPIRWSENGKEKILRLTYKIIPQGKSRYDGVQR